MNKEASYKKLVDSCLKMICKLIARFYSYSLNRKIILLKTKVYTFWISSELKKNGKKTLLCYPINLRGGKYVSIGENTGIGSRGIITAWDRHNEYSYVPEIIIGDNTWIGEDCHITAINKIQIGNNVLIGKQVTITDNAHGKSEYNDLQVAPKSRNVYSKGPVIIGDNVWIGDKATILPGVKIGKNAIVGANSVITKDIEKNCVAGGNPAKILKIIDENLPNCNF